MTMENLENKRHCIFCQRKEEDFEKDNMFTEEHIVPFALGNRTLKTNDVCKKCNSGLGTNVDNYVLDNMIIKMLRQTYRLPGQSGRIPNPFSKGKDKDGNTVFVDDSFVPRLQEHKEEDGNRIHIVAPSRDKAKAMVKKTLERKGASKDQIEEAVSKIDKVDSKIYQPEVSYDLEIDINRFKLEALKIAYEYAIYVLKDKYEKDPKCKEIREILQKGINGEYKEVCPDISLVSQMDPTLFKMISMLPFPCHVVMIHPDAQGYLVAQISLFVKECLSYSVLISEKACDYQVDEDNFTIIDINGTGEGNNLNFSI